MNPPHATKPFITVSHVDEEETKKDRHTHTHIYIHWVQKSKHTFHKEDLKSKCKAMSCSQKYTGEFLQYITVSKPLIRTAPEDVWSEDSAAAVGSASVSAGTVSSSLPTA